MFGQLKLAMSVGLAGVSTITIPSTILLLSGKGSQDIFQPLLNSTAKIQSMAHDHMSGFDEQLQGKYVDFGTSVGENLSAAPAKTQEKMISIGETGKTTSEFLNKHGEDVNYYAFKAGALVKSLFKYTPHLIKESLVELWMSEEDKQNTHLLNIQKIVDMVSHEEFSNAMPAVINVGNMHAAKLGEMSNKDAEGVVQIIKEIPRSKEGMTQFLKNLKKNAESIKQGDEFCNATKLMLHLFVGKDEVGKISQTVSSLKAKMEELKDSLEKILAAVGISQDTLKKQLEEIEKRSALFSNPCPGEES